MPSAAKTEKTNGSKKAKFFQYNKYLYSQLLNIQENKKSHGKNTKIKFQNISPQDFLIAKLIRI